jgi:hypothetical protein
MLTALILLFLIAVVFWRSVVKFLLAVLLALLVLGGIQVARTIGSITDVPANHTVSLPR